MITQLPLPTIPEAPPAVRTCSRCSHTLPPRDPYRFYLAGAEVCSDCWTSMDSFTDDWRWFVIGKPERGCCNVRAMAHREGKPVTYGARCECHPDVEGVVG